MSLGDCSLLNSVFSRKFTNLRKQRFWQIAIEVRRPNKFCFDLDAGHFRSKSLSDQNQDRKRPFSSFDFVQTNSELLDRPNLVGSFLSSKPGNNYKKIPPSYATPGGCRALLTCLVLVSVFGNWNHCLERFFFSRWKNVGRIRMKRKQHSLPEQKFEEGWSENWKHFEWNLRNNRQSILSWIRNGFRENFILKEIFIYM